MNILFFDCKGGNLKKFSTHVLYSITTSYKLLKKNVPKTTIKNTITLNTITGKPVLFCLSLKELLFLRVFPHSLTVIITDISNHQSEVLLQSVQTD